MNEIVKFYIHGYWVLNEESSDFKFIAIKHFCQ